MKPKFRLGCIFLSILKYLNGFSLCDGISYENHVLVVRNPASETKCIAMNVNGQNRFVSTKCHQLVANSERVCSSCRYVHKLLLRCKEEYVHSKKIKNILLSEKEKNQKDQ